MPQLTISRPKILTNSISDYSIYANGKLLGTIGRGKTKTFELKTGVYQVEARVNWCSSQSMTADLVNNQEQRYNLHGFKFSNYLYPLMLFFAFYLFISNQRMDGYSTIVLILMGALLLYVFYYLTLGRKHYIRIFMT